MKLILSRNCKIILSLTDIHVSCTSREFLTSQICLLMLFTKIKYEFTVFDDFHEILLLAGYDQKPS